PNCEVMISKTARVCPNCGHTMPVKIKDEVTQMTTFPKLVEILNKQEKQQYEWIRKQIKTNILSGLNTATIVDDFFKKFKRFPPKDWLRGAIFGYSNAESIGYYSWYLTKMGNSDARKSFALSLEFGDGKTLDFCPLKHWNIKVDYTKIELEQAYSRYIREGCMVIANSMLATLSKM
ncbi:MAG: hypothetical protein ACRDBG_20760, partial [Waterburya sp.]